MAKIRMTNGNSTKDIDENLKELYAKVGWKEVKETENRPDYHYNPNDKK